MQEEPKFAKSEYGQKDEQEKSNEELKPSEIAPSQIVVAVVFRTTVETLSALKRDLGKCFEKHDAVVVYQRASTGYLKIVEELNWTKEQLRKGGE